MRLRYLGLLSLSVLLTACASDSTPPASDVPSACVQLETSHLTFLADTSDLTLRQETIDLEISIYASGKELCTTVDSSPVDAITVRNNALMIDKLLRDIKSGTVH